MNPYNSARAAGRIQRNFLIVLIFACLVFGGILTSGAQSLHLDGTNDFVLTGIECDDSVLPSITWEAWVKPTNSTTADWQMLMNSENGGWDRFVAIKDGWFSMGIGDGPYQPVGADFNQWQHVAVVYTGTTVKFYKNGVLYQYDGVNVANQNCLGNPFRFGKANYGGGAEWPYRGYVDNLRVWSLERTQDQIIDNMNCVLASQTGLLAQYLFNQGTPSGNNGGVTSVEDNSGNGNNGTLNNFGLNGAQSNWVNDYLVPKVTASDYFVTEGTSKEITFQAVQPEYQLDDVVYQWRKNGEAVGSNSTTYTSDIDETSTITCAIVICTGEQASRPAVVTETEPMALDFDYNNYVSVAISESQGEITHELWFKTTEPNGGLLSVRDSPLGGSFDREIFLSNGKVGSYVWNGGSGDEVIKSSQTYADGEWHHVAVSLGQNEGHRLYVDGELVANGVLTQSAFNWNTHITLGYAYFGNNYFDGQLDEVRVWNKALTLSEITGKMNCALSVGEPNLLIHYVFDQGLPDEDNTGVTILYDQTGNNYHGALSGFALVDESSNWVANESDPLLPMEVAIYTSQNSIPVSGANVEFNSVIKSVGFNSSIQWTKNGSVVSTDPNYSTFALPTDVFKLKVTRVSDCSPSSITATRKLPAFGNAQALDFDGGEYVNLNESVLNNLGAFTVEGWVYLADNGTYSLFGQNEVVELFLDGSDIVLLLNGIGQSLGETHGIPLSTWAHVAATGDGTTTRIFINGEEIGSENAATSDYGSSSSSAKIGGYVVDDGDSYFLNGRLDEIRFWSVARTAAEIRNNMFCAIAGAQSGLIANYNFNQGLDGADNHGISTLTDLSGNNHHGTLTDFELEGSASNWVTRANPTVVVSIGGDVPSPICAGNTVVYTAAVELGGDTPSYQWYVNDSPEGTDDDEFTTSTLAHDDVVRCEVQSSFSCFSPKASNLIPMIVNSAVPSQPGAFTTSAASICETASSAFEVPTDANTTSYIWDYTGTGETIKGSSTRIELTLADGATAGNISVTPKNGCGAGTARTLAVAVDETPAAPMILDVTESVCQGAIGIPFDVVDEELTYTWNYSGADATINGSGVSILVNFGNTATSGVLSVTGATSKCTSPQSVVPIVVNKLPITPADFVTSSSNVCEGQRGVKFAIESREGETYTWVYSNEGAFIKGTSSRVSVDFVVGTTSGILSVAASTGCGTSDALTLDLEVVRLPLQPDAFLAGEEEVCAGTSVVYTVPTEPLLTYVWKYSGKALQSVNGSSNELTFDDTSTGGVLKVTAKNECASSVARTIEIKVNKKPGKPAAISGQGTLCQGAEGVSYKISNKPNVTYAWTFTGEDAEVIGTSNEAEVSFGAASDSGELSVTASNECGASEPSIKVITINPTPVKPVISMDTSDPEKPVLTTGSAEKYRWFFEGERISTSASVAAKNGGSYTVMVINKNCESELSAAQVIVIAGFEKEIGNKVQLYPNPASRQISLALDVFEKDKPVSILVVDQLGRVFDRTQGEGQKELTINVGHYAAGNYFVLMNQANRSVTKRFVKE